MESKKVLIGMSGGVDSSVAALLMKQAGYNCIGATMHLYSSGSCNAPDHAADARNVAQALGIPFYELSFQTEFEDTVIRKFISCYECGLTPNPCIECNRNLKFGHLMRAALDMSCDYVVSGHYARILQDPDSGRYLLYKAKDSAKDQTYFLACLNQEQLAHILFPLGELTKQEARILAEENGFLNARKRDSQDICFVPDGDYAAFMSRHTGKDYPEGNYLDMAGNIIGRHKGAVCYTLGQRKGLGIALGQPAYVCAKNMMENTVTLGPNEALFSQGLRATDWNWFPFPTLMEPLKVSAKIRHSQMQIGATVYPEDEGHARVMFDAPQRAVTPGQAVVLYQGDCVIGGGTITESLTIK